KKHEQKLAKLTKLITEVIRIQTKIEKTKNIQQIEQKFERILSRYKEYEKQKKWLKKLEQVAHKVKIRKAYLKSTQYIDDCFMLVRKTDEEYQKYQTKQHALAKLKRLIGSVTSLNQSIQRIEREISLLEKEFRKLCPDECPLC